MAEIREFLSSKAQKQVEKFIQDLGLITGGYSDLEKAMIKASTVYEKQAKAAKEVDKVYQKTQKTKKEINAADKESERINKALLSTQAKLEKVYSAENQQLVKKRAELNKVNKELRENEKEQRSVEERTKRGIKDAREITGRYKELSDTLREQRAVAKDLAATYGTGSEQFKKAATEVQRLDAELKEIDSSVGQNQRDVGNYFGSWITGIKATTKALLANPIGLIIGAAVAAFKGLQALITRNSAAADKFRQVWGGISEIFQVVLGRVTTLAGSVVKLIKGDFKGAFLDAKAAVSGVREEMEGAYTAGVELVKLQQQLKKDTAAAGIELAKLEGQLQRLNVIESDTTRSLEERAAAAERARDIEVLIARERIKIAQQAEGIAKREYDRAVETQGLTNETLVTYQELYAERIRLESDLQTKLLENQKVRNEIRQDQIEQELDFLIDGFDKQKTINERRIADEELVFEERQRLLEETKELAKASFDDQVELLQNAAQEQIDINALIQESDARVILAQAQNAGLSEILAKRLLEVINERKLAINDLEEAEKGLFETSVRGAGVELAALDRNFDQKIKLEKKYTEEVLRESNVRKVAVQKDEEDISAEREAGLQLAIDSVNAAFSLGKEKRTEELSEEQAKADKELELLEAQRDRGVITEEQYSARKARIDEQLQKKQKEARTKDAKAEKAQSLFSIAINTAKAIVAALPNIALSVLVGSIGAIQAAVVAAKRIPQFEKGTKSSPEGVAEVGERGRELLIYPSGQTVIADHSYQYLPKGTEVKTNYETERILAGYDSPEVQNTELLNKMDVLTNVIRNKRELTINARKGTITDRGNEYYNRYFKRLLR